LDRKIRVGAVNYLNTKPLLYGIERSPIINQINLEIDYPARIAERLLLDEIDVGLVPVAILPLMKDYYLNTDYCIGCDGAVASVCLFSDVPIEQIQKVLLDYQSKTSVQLARILLKHYWKVAPEFAETSQDFLSQISGSTAAVLIGDRALRQRHISPYIYDLGEAWKRFTGFSFVFAAWVSSRELDEPFAEAFNRANQSGLESIPLLLTGLHSDFFDLRQYYTQHISYNLDENKRKGLELFLNYLKEFSLSSQLSN